MTRKLALALSLALVVMSGCSSSNDPESLDITASEETAESTVKVDPGAVVAYLKAAGLPIGRVDTYNSENDPFKLAGRPDRYTTKVVFADTRFNKDACEKVKVLAWDECGGTVEVFNNAEELRKWKQSVVLAREQTPNAPPEYRYEKNLSLLRLGYVLTPQQAKEYETAYAAFPG